MGLKEYHNKRNFKKTREPEKNGIRSQHPRFVIQEHWASHHHFDLRLEAFGTLKSWAVPKGPSNQVGEKRLAVEVEDHPLSYAGFEGEIPKGEYGAGQVKIWDEGIWQPPPKIRESFKKGHVVFELHGKKLRGQWVLQRTGSSGSKNMWLLIKKQSEQKKRSKKIPLTAISPQLATLTKRVPTGADWIHEIKWDGYRAIVQIQNRKVKIFSRNGLDWTKKYQTLEKEFKKIPIEQATLDGEVVVLDRKGRGNFSLLQDTLKGSKLHQLRFVAFDLLALNQFDIRKLPLKNRKELLEKLIRNQDSKNILYSGHLASGKKLFSKMCLQGQEGIISKNQNAAYQSGRSRDWYKVKCANKQEFVVGGYTESTGATRSGFGALLVGFFKDGKLSYAGRIGSGFSQQTMKAVFKKISRLEIKKSPFEISSPADSRSVHWVKPKIMIEVKFGAWTAGGIVRHGVFQGIRSDKAESEVEFEVEQKKKEESPIKITHPERILFEKGHITKSDVADYYLKVAPWIMPHIARRPLSFIRCPSKAGPNCFYQKHFDSSQVNELKESRIRKQLVNFIENETSLIHLVQFGVIEFHSWQTHVDNSLNPDQIIFDLDPDPSVKWSQVIRTAIRLRKILTDLKLKSFVKTTGGKGLHIHIPIGPFYSWDQIKEFSKVVSQQLASEFPNDYTIVSSKVKRRGKIFLDYLRNNFGATAVAPYSLRSKDTATVAFPVTWEALAKIKNPARFNLSEIPKHLSRRKRDPWQGYNNLRQRIEILELAK